jgi:hypothetical protein
MSKETLNPLDPRRQQAVTELIEMIKRHYPTASFVIGPGEDAPDATHIVATVDVDDPDEVMDLIIDREIELQVDEGIPIYVIPIQPAERAEGAMRRSRAQKRSRARLPLASG